MQLPTAQVTQAVIQRYARVWARHQADLSKRALVLPTAKFFPDPFRGDADSAARIAARMREQAGMSDIPIRTALVALDEHGTTSSGCGSGACGVPQTAGTGLARVVDEGDGWLLRIPEPEMRHPVALTTNVARSLAYVFLVETMGELEVLEPPVDVTVDFTAVALGFGALMLQGSYIYAKSCGGPQVTRVTKVALPELAVAVALFAALGAHDLGAAKNELDATQRAVLSDAEDLVRANRQLTQLLLTSPALVAQGRFDLQESRGRVGNWLRRFSSKAPSSSGRGAQLPPIDPGLELDELESLLISMPPSSSAGRRSDRPPPPPDELKDLVAEALRY